jgi:hypothetical protein
VRITGDETHGEAIGVVVEGDQVAQLVGHPQAQTPSRRFGRGEQSGERVGRPLPWSVTVPTIRSGAGHTRSWVGGSPWQ